MCASPSCTYTRWLETFPRSSLPGETSVLSDVAVAGPRPCIFQVHVAHLVAKKKYVSAVAGETGACNQVFYRKYITGVRPQMARPEGGGGKLVAAAGDIGLAPADGKKRDSALSFTTTGSSNTEDQCMQTCTQAVAPSPGGAGKQGGQGDVAQGGEYSGAPKRIEKTPAEMRVHNVSPAAPEASSNMKGAERRQGRETAAVHREGGDDGYMVAVDAALGRSPVADAGRREEEAEESTLPEDAAPAKETQSAPAALGQAAAANAAARAGRDKEVDRDSQHCHGPDCACTRGAEEDAHDDETKPLFFSLCTKCAHEGKRGPHARREPVRGLIIRSESFMNASDASRWEVEEYCSSSSSSSAEPRQHQIGGGTSGGATATAAAGSVGTAAGTAQAPGSPHHEGPVFDRSRIVHEVLLEGGQQINDIYDIPNGVSLGKGSYGSVVKAKDIKTNMMRAVKVVYKPRIENVTRLKREILIMKRLDHPNIIKLLEVYEDLKNLYLVMELCTGGELFERIIKSGHFSERYAASLMKQIFSAASYCHSQNVIHRDLKPENLLYADSSPLSALKVIDWGFAARCGKSHKFSSVVGTPYYVAPEVLFGKYGSECDMWSAGVILHILLCGYPPFHGKDNQEILKKVQVGEFSFDARHWRRVSDHAKDLVKRCLTYVPGMRITAAEALQHPWIQCYTGTGAGMRLERPISMQLGGDLIERFKAFQRLHKLKKLAITCVAYQLSDADIGTLHDAFAALDTNADGVLTVAELKQGLKQCCVAGDDINEILKEMDTDGNGTIDYTEFIAASIDHKIYEQESACQAAFKVFDLDGDGKITVEELQKILETRYVQEAFSKEAVAEMLKEVCHTGADITPVLLFLVLSTSPQADVNNDGCIDFDEFMRMMRGRQRKVSESSSPLARARALLYRRYEG